MGRHCSYSLPSPPEPSSPPASSPSGLRLGIDLFAFTEFASRVRQRFDLLLGKGGEEREPCVGQPSEEGGRWPRLEQHAGEGGQVPRAEQQPEEGGCSGSNGCEEASTDTASVFRLAREAPWVPVRGVTQRMAPWVLDCR